MSFIKLNDGGIINEDNILEFEPRLRRIRYVHGGQRNLDPRDVEKLLDILTFNPPESKPQQTRRKAPKKTTKE